jgi:RNA polymerase sigma factor (sigma-70 family)
MFVKSSLMKYQSDQSCIYACLQGEQLAYRHLYEQYKGQMFRVCLRYADNRQEAEDFLQEGFAKAFRVLPTFEGKGDFGAWLRRIMVNTAIDRLRRRKPFASELSEKATDLIAFNDLSSDNNCDFDPEAVLYAVALLPDTQRMVFNLFAMEGYSHQEIAKEMDIAESSSRSLLTRARASLKRQLSGMLI